MKKLYVYDYLDRCSPDSGAYHEEGGLLVITGGYPNDAVPLGTGNKYTVDSVVKYGLPEATLTIEVPDSTPDRIIVFPDSGCC